MCPPMNCGVERTASDSPGSPWTSSCCCWSAAGNWCHTMSSRSAYGRRTYAPTLKPASVRPSSRSGGCCATRASRHDSLRRCRARRGDFAQARVHASEALSLSQELEDPRGIPWSLEVFAGLSAAAGLADGAARLWGAAEGLLESVGGSLAPSIRWVRDRYIEHARTSVGETAFEAARGEGRAMSPLEAVAFARQRALPGG
jgi:hypothetical protein